MREMTITVPPEFDGATALSVLRRNGFSHRMITKLKASGGITRCGEILRTIDAVHAGDAIRIVIGSGEGVQGAAPSLI